VLGVLITPSLTSLASSVGLCKGNRVASAVKLPERRHLVVLLSTLASKIGFQSLQVADYSKQQGSLARQARALPIRVVRRTLIDSVISLTKARSELAFLCAYY
jgi:hypothetical protein